MPRNVRNWWIELEVDGKKTKIGAGPRRKDGGFTLRIHQRNRGGVVKNVVRIDGDVVNEERLETWIDVETLPYPGQMRVTTTR